MSEKKLDVLSQFRTERDMKYKNGLYYYVQVNFAYNTSHMEGSQLSEDETRLIYETQRIIADEKSNIKINDVIETRNHFRCFDYLLDIAKEKLSEDHMKELHRILKQGSDDETNPYFKIGGYKWLENRVGKVKTSRPEDVYKDMDVLVDSYHSVDMESKNANERLESIVDFHARFEKIHPFQDGNGRVGRLIMFKECIAQDVMPFVIEDENRIEYLYGLQAYQLGDTNERLMAIILHEQNVFGERFEKYAFPAEDEKIGIIRSPERDLRREARDASSSKNKEDGIEQ